MVTHLKAFFVGSKNKEEQCKMEAPKTKAALSQVEYLEKQFQQVKEDIAAIEGRQKEENDQLRDLYFKKGKLFSEIELMKRVPSY